jgi:hypothetical protein
LAGQNIQRITPIDQPYRPLQGIHGILPSFIPSQLLFVHFQFAASILILIVSLIQMRLMKVIYKIKNILIQEFQYSSRFQFPMILKNFESMFDEQHQSESHFQ